MTERAEKQQKAANLVFVYDGASRVSCDKPNLAENGASLTFNLTGLLERVRTLKVKKQLAVVIIGKVMSYGLSRPQLEKEMDRLEAILKQHGFRKVIFHLAHSTFTPILRE